MEKYSRKDLQRKYALQARKSMTKEQHEAFDQIIAKKILQTEAIKNAKVVMSYQAYAGEVNLQAVHDILRKNQVRLVFPKSEKHGIMHAYEPLQEELLEKDSMGIVAPIVGNSVFVCPEDIEVILVPLVAFDESGMRLGWGGGYYDRFLETCPNAHTIGVAYELQKVEKVEADSIYDIALHEVITETAHYLNPHFTKV